MATTYVLMICYLLLSLLSHQSSVLMCVFRHLIDGWLPFSNFLLRHFHFVFFVVSRKNMEMEASLSGFGQLAHSLS